MNTENTNPGNDPDNNQWKKGQETNNSRSNIGDTDEKAKLVPNKDKDYKVLHNDGSLADLPDNDVPGAGALDGTVGLGT
jgi:hypothetical protein